jgi:hypothetical protein
MAWDAAKGRSTKAPTWFDNLYASVKPERAIVGRSLAPLPSWYKAFDAAENSAWVAYSICAANLAGAWFLYHEPPEVVVLFGRSPEAVAIANLVAAVLAAWLGLVIRRSHPIWAAWVVMAWAVAEALPWVSRFIYGQYVPFFIGFIMFWFAVLGLRGAYALRRTDPSDPANLGLAQP